MTLKWFAGLSLTAALAALVVAGCGGGGGGSRLSKADFISQADAICQKAHEDENKVSFPNVNPSTASQDDLKKFGDAIKQATAIDRKEVDDLKALKPPEDFQDNYDEALQELSDGLDHADNAVDEANKGDTAGLTRELNAVQSKATEANKKAAAYGLKVCGANNQ